MLYRDWYSQYMALYKSKLAPRTREEYDRMQRVYLSPVLGSMELAAITPEDVQRCLLLAADRGGPRQAQAVFSLIRAIMRRACRSRLVPWSPVEALDKPEHTPEEGKQLTDRDYQAVLPFVRNDVALSLALFAGLRRGEICGLQWGDVDLQHGVLHIRRQRQRVDGQLIVKTPKSAAGCRDVPISPELLPLLRQEFRFFPRAFVVGCSPEHVGHRWTAIQQRDVLLSQHYRLHDLRHTYGSRLILSGCLPRVVQYLMGHASLEVTMRVYSHVSPEQAADEVRKVYAASLH